MTQREWVEWYESKTGGKMELAPDETVLFDPDNGFVSFFVHGDILEIHHMAAKDGVKLARSLKALMAASGLKRARWFTRRSPAAWERKYGCHVRGFYMEADIDELKI